MNLYSCTKLFQNRTVFVNVSLWFLSMCVYVQNFIGVYLFVRLWKNSGGKHNCLKIGLVHLR